MFILCSLSKKLAAISREKAGFGFFRLTTTQTNFGQKLGMANFSGFIGNLVVFNAPSKSPVGLCRESPFFLKSPDSKLEPGFEIHSKSPWGPSVLEASAEIAVPV